MPSVPKADEAAEEGVSFLASFDPELACKVVVADVAALIPVWLHRRTNAGRRGKEHHIDDTLCALVTKLGHGPITPEAMRRQRLAFEKRYPTTPRAASWGKAG